MRLGVDKVDAEPRAVDDIVSRCAGLPLALAIVAARAQTRPSFPLGTLISGLDGPGDGPEDGPADGPEDGPAGGDAQGVEGGGEGPRGGRADSGDSADGLDVFDGGDASTNMRTVLSWSYRALTPDAARLFRLCGLLPAPEISTAAAASLAGDPGTPGAAPADRADQGEPGRRAHPGTLR